MTPLWLGLVAGSAHVFAGPDHLAALAPVVADRPAEGSRTGFAWGLGHGLGVVLLGTLGQLLRDAIRLEAVSAWSEVAVGVLLVAVGVFAFVRSRSLLVHRHPHAHDRAHHAHLHAHVGSAADRHAPRDHAFHGHARRVAFGVGMVHGTAGVGHLLGVVPSLFLGPAAAALYLGAYLVAAVASMAAFGALAGRWVRSLGPDRIPTALRWTSTLCVAVGIVWVWRALT